MADLDRIAREIGEAWLGFGHHDAAALSADILAALRRVEAETRKECARIAEGFRCGACGMDGKAAAAIRKGDS